MSQRRLSYPKLFAYCVFLLLVLSSASCHSKQVPPAQTTQNAAKNIKHIEPRALDLLKKACDILKTADSFRFYADITNEELTPDGPKIEYSATVQVALKRPDSFTSLNKGDLNHRRFSFANKQFTLLDHSNSVYAEAEAPSGIDAALKHIMDKYQISVPLIDLLYSDPFAVISNEIRGGYYVGLHQVRGIPCHHLVFGNDIIDWQVWIQEQGEPLLRKVVITYKLEPGAPSYRAEFSKWKLEPGLPKNTFKVDVPSNYVKINFLEKTEKAGGLQ